MAGHEVVCTSCGEVHQGLPTDRGFGLPDEVFALSYLDAYRRVRSNADLCTLDERRFFIRGVLEIPFLYREDAFAWGLWAEVSKQDHDLYVNSFNDASAQGRMFSGALANAIPGVNDTVGLLVSIEFQDPASRPTFVFPSSADHVLAVDQRNGINEAQHHRMLELCGHFKGSRRMDVAQQASSWEVAPTGEGAGRLVSRNPESAAITSWHFYKNAAGFFGFVSLFVYCGILLALGPASGAVLFIALGMLAALLISVRSGKRLLLLRRMRMAQRR
ncbi:DUF2199 domain-containing protein [Xanthomonas sp. LMG 12459]|uniref:DUF2199 domain-containing protein n=1 Tax=Xanthomonas sp. LMG 12459 TaxID=1591131 RepID=UPI0012632580|nr:DUF2199 domain-containing protein [Xanthomonas sp. LMG 12459]KAB7779488.1 hypothetical protein CEK65_04715 [Xanthomonas sp. LMG 12459]